MFANTKAYSGFAVDDLQKAREFYGETLGLRTSAVSEEGGLMSLDLAGDRSTLVYEKPDCMPASYTILNFPVDDIDKAVDELVARGVQLRALRRLRAGREGHRPRPGAGHRLVQGPGRQRAVGAPGELRPLPLLSARPPGCKAA